MGVELAVGTDYSIAVEVVVGRVVAVVVAAVAVFLAVASARLQRCRLLSSAAMICGLGSR